MSNHPVRDKLGLALAGGGFRATLFHIGVFRRLADLDLLRYVEVLSAVSGGSIIAALYTLLLKRELERPELGGYLSHAHYLKIVDDLETRLCLGIQKNLRTRLFMNPFDLAHGIRTGDNLSRAMAGLYEKHLFRETIDELSEPPHSSNMMPLRAIKINPAGRAIDLERFGDIDSYNADQAAGEGSVITKLILNATSLNSGSRFWFSGSEIGEWDFGYLHQDDESLINALKPRVEQARSGPLPVQPSDDYQVGDSLNWWSTKGKTDALPERWQRLFPSWQRHFTHTDSHRDNLKALLGSKLGTLRLARRAAWYLAKESTQGVLLCGMSKTQHRLILATKLGFICHQYAEQVLIWLDALRKEGQLLALCQLINDIYLVRSADYLADTAARDLTSFPLSYAVAASANFPPLFSPFQLTNFYDNLHLSRLGLTDGGVYDNLGITGLLDEGCNHIISSDTGLTSGLKQRVSNNRFGMMARIVSILADDDIRQTKAMLLERHRISAGLGRITHRLDSQAAQAVTEKLEHVHTTRELFSVAAFRIDSAEIHECNEESERRPYTAFDLARIRTDLDAFGDIEIDALIDQGYANSGTFLKRWFGIDATREAPEHLIHRYGLEHQRGYPYCAAMMGDECIPAPRTPAKKPSKELTRETLRAARSRIPHIFRLWHSPFCWLAWATLLLALSLCWFWLDGHSVNIASALQQVVAGALFLKELELDREISWHQLLSTLAIFAAIGLLLWGLAKGWFPLFEWLRQKGYIKLARKMSSSARLPRLISAFIGSLALRLTLFLFAWLAYFYTYLYLLATNLGPKGKSSRTSRDA